MRRLKHQKKVRLILKRHRKPKCLKGNVNDCRRKSKLRNLNKCKNSRHHKKKSRLRSLKSLLKSCQLKKSSLSVKEPKRNKWRKKDSINSRSRSVKSKCIRIHRAIMTSTTSMSLSSMNTATTRKAITSMVLTITASTEMAMTIMAILGNKSRNTTASRNLISNASKNVSRKNIKRHKQLLKPGTNKINKPKVNQLLTKRMRLSLKKKRQRICVRKSWSACNLKSKQD